MTDKVHSTLLLLHRHY